jgi:hypothetical protein
MAIVTSYDWKSDSWTHHNGDNPTRQIWRDAVAEIAEKAKQTLPQCNGRVDSAVKIVLAGDVELLPDGKAKVASQSHGTTLYHIVNGECSCKDYAKAPSNWCKHRIAAGLAKRASALTKQRLEQVDAASNDTTSPTPEQVDEAPVATPVQETVATPILPLPEAASSANCFVTLAGRQVQLTLRDHDEQRLLQRLEALLQQFPVVEEPRESAQKEGWCHKHNVQMKLNHGKRGSWWSHKLPNGQWCNQK